MSEEERTTSFVPLQPGTTVLHYRIVDRIGAGGMGEVYLAEDTRLHRKVALKFLPASVARDGDIRARFRREAQAAAALDHPNIVTIHDVSEFDNRPFIAMQYVEGKTLQHYCQNESLEMRQIIDIVAQIADGLARAHAAGIVHRDIKSSNIILNMNGRAKILDFGLATIMGGEDITRDGSTLGTMAYMSPEQAQGQDLDHRSDLFSLGVVLYELLAGQSPFKRTNDAATLQAIINDAPEPLARFKSVLPGDLERIVRRCLAKNRNERYQSAADLAAELRLVVANLSGGSTGGAAPHDDRTSIAVLPFANMSADPENEYFADGLTEELLNVLAKSPDLKVTGRTSSFAFKGKQEDLRGIGQKLGVGTILEGSVRKAGNRVRITAQLVNSSDGFHLWSETYDRVLDDIFAVQDEIAEAVSKAMHVTLRGDAVTKQTDNPESYALVLRANHAMMQMSKASNEVAGELYERALELDPNNARAWAGLSRVHMMRYAYGYVVEKDEVARSRRNADQFARKALELDDRLPEAYDTLGWLLTAIEFKWDESREAASKAFELAPGNSRIIASMAIHLFLRGETDKAIELSKQATDIDPLDPEMLLQRGRILAYSGHLDEAERVVKRALRLSPELTTAYSSLSWIEYMRGNYEKCVSYAERENQSGYRDCSLAIAYHAAGMKEKSDRALEALHQQDEQWGFQFAVAHAVRGELDEAFEWLEKSFERHDSGIPLTRVHPLLESLHDDPRWLPFLKKINMAD